MSTRPQLFGKPILRKPILRRNCSQLCGVCKWSMFCPEFWQTQHVMLPDRKDRKYWPGNPDQKYHRK